MIAPLHIWEATPRSRALATVDPRVGDCIDLTEFIHDRDQLARGQRSSARHTHSLLEDFRSQSHRETLERGR